LAPNASLVVIAPHPDDETLGCGGLIGQYCDRGHRIKVVYVSDGGASDREIPRRQLAAIRREEAIAAMRVLGLASDALVFINAPDGELDRLPIDERRRCVDELARAISEARADHVFTPCAADGSSEHTAVFALLNDALATVAPRPHVLQYPVWSWWNPRFLLPLLIRSQRWYSVTFPAHAGRKVQALACYRSQIQSTSAGRPPLLSAEFLACFGRGEEFFLEG
jgi:LmbE family N-acetylglucosaminyl deacetylase